MKKGKRELKDIKKIEVTKNFLLKDGLQAEKEETKK
jgi:hypothetical protein